MLVKKLGKPDHEPYRTWDTISQSIGSCLVLQKKNKTDLEKMDKTTPDQLPDFPTPRHHQRVIPSQSFSVNLMQQSVTSPVPKAKKCNPSI